MLFPFCPEQVTSDMTSTSSLVRDRAGFAASWVTLVLVVSLATMPLVVIAASLLQPSTEMWSELWATRLPGMIVNTLVLQVAVLAGSVFLGTALAWVMTAYQFPFRRIIGWLLVLPLTIPSYVAGFVWLDTLSGIFGARGVRSLWLCAITMILTLYPYVYLFARASFQSQGAESRDAARMMGVGQFRMFFRVAMPMARPGIAAGAALVLMEVLTDVGTVRLFNVSTVADGVLRVWFGTGSRQNAAELAMTLVVFAVGLIALERALRGGSRYSTRATRRPMEPVMLGLRGAFVVVSALMGVLTVAAVVPLVRLVVWSLDAVKKGATATVAGGLWDHASSSLMIAGSAMVSCIVCGVVIASIGRHRGTAGRILSSVAALGYAMPGPVVAVGAVIVLAAGDRSRIVPDGAVLVGSVAGVVYALTVRFLAVALHGAESGFDQVSPSTLMSARMLGAKPIRVTLSVQLPAARTTIVAAASLLSIDLIKELPITLLLRPFGVDTLSVWVWQSTSESLWSQAAIPSLAIIFTGMLAVGVLLAALERGAEVAS